MRSRFDTSNFIYSKLEQHWWTVCARVIALLYCICSELREGALLAVQQILYTVLQIN